MSRQTFIFVGTTARDADLMRLVEQKLGRQFTHEQGSDPYIQAGTAAVYVGRHEFDDDDITSPDGPEIPLHSRFPAMIEVRDTKGDQRRQQEIADEIFAALRSSGRWPVAYIDDMQKVLGYYDPAEWQARHELWPPGPARSRTISGRRRGGRGRRLRR
jgi:hypothetical protein